MAQLPGARPRRRLLRIVAGVLVVLTAGAAVAAAGVGISAVRLGLTFRAQAVRLALPVLMQEDPTDADEHLAEVLERQSGGPSLPSAAFRERFDVSMTEVEGRTVVTASPRGGAGAGTTVLYLHGGGYVSDITFVYWDLVARLVDETSATVVVPLYGLAPTSTWKEGQALVQSVYGSLVDEVGADSIVIAGDSAGGGLALAAAQQIRDAGLDRPAGIVLFSPWLDATLSDPAQPGLDAADHILSLHGLRRTGTWWAGDLSTRDPRVSPLFGSLDDLPPVALFTSTEDLLHPDATRFETQARAAGLSVTTHTYPHEQHAWVVLFPALVPEAQRAIDQAARFVNDVTARGERVDPRSR